MSDPRAVSSTGQRKPTRLSPQLLEGLCNAIVLVAFTRNLKTFGLEDGLISFMKGLPVIEGTNPCWQTTICVVAREVYHY